MKTFLGAVETDAEPDVAPARGKYSEDVTTFVEHQRHWSIDNLPDILYQWKPQGPRRPASEPVMAINESTGKEVERFENVPAYLSTQVEGWRIEAMMREDVRITYKGLWDLMRAVPGRPTRIHTLQMRAQRFRQQYRIRTWATRDTDSFWSDQIDRALTPQQKAANTTRDLEPYSPAEFRALQKSRNGTQPQRSRKGGQKRKALGSKGRDEDESESQIMSSTNRLESVAHRLTLA